MNQFLYRASVLIKPRKEAEEPSYQGYTITSHPKESVFSLIRLRQREKHKKAWFSQRHMSHHSPFPPKWARSWSSWSWKPMCRSPGILYTRSLQWCRKTTDQWVMLIQVWREKEGGNAPHPPPHPPPLTLQKSNEKQKSKMHTELYNITQQEETLEGSKRKSAENNTTFYWVVFTESDIYC